MNVLSFQGYLCRSQAIYLIILPYRGQTSDVHIRLHLHKKFERQIFFTIESTGFGFLIILY